MEERKVKKGSYGYSNDGYLDFMDCMHTAWPWQRLNAEEKNYINNIFIIARPDQGIEYQEAWDKGGDLWTSCLKLLGYQPMGWREDKDGKPIIPPCDTEYVLVPRKKIEALKNIMADLNKVI